jgi:hypothetical protein
MVSRGCLWVPQAGRPPRVPPDPEPELGQPQYSCEDAARWATLLLLAGWLPLVTAGASALAQAHQGRSRGCRVAS